MKGTTGGRGAGIALTTGAAGASVLTVLVSGWWALPVAVCAFLAGRRPGGARQAAFALAAVLAADMVAVFVAPSWLTPGTRFVAVVLVAGVLTWCAGRFWQQYRELARAGWERAERLERERQLIAEQARLRERARIAQDMHDVLGHDLSLIALSAGALKLAPGLDGDQRAAAGAIRARAATAVERLGEIVGVLRDGAAGTPAHAPGSGSGTDIARLVSEAAASGLTVGSDLDRAGAEAPDAVLRATHRVVQEALTNVAKHAPGATASVHVTRTDAETCVEVSNGPSANAGSASVTRGATPAPVAASYGGRGLVGLDERVRLAGGTFTWGPRPDGGFTVGARLPHAPVPPGPAGRRAPPAPPASPGPTPGPAPALVPAPAGEAHREYRRTRRRLGRRVLTALTLSLLAAALLGGVLTWWDMLVAKRSVLASEDFVRLRAGQGRAELAPYLPGRQTTHLPAHPPPTEHGTTCEFYAISADPFDDSSGDAYRLCFRADTLVSAEVLRS